MAELDAAMARILTSNPHYNDEFKARYSAINVGSSSLTDGSATGLRPATTP